MALTETNLHFRRLTPVEATAYLVGTNVGAAILALPYAARHAGYIGIILTCLAATAFSLLSHLAVAEAMLRTPNVTQLVGLFRTYLFPGRAGVFYLWFLFFVTIGVAIPTLTAYVLGGAETLTAIFGLKGLAAEALFLLPGAAVVWLGLKTTGIVQKLASAAMGLALLLLTVWSLRHTAGGSYPAGRLRSRRHLAGPARGRLYLYVAGDRARDRPRPDLRTPPDPPGNPLVSSDQPGLLPGGGPLDLRAGPGRTPGRGRHGLLGQDCSAPGAWSQPISSLSSPC